MEYKIQNAIVIIANYLGTNNVPRVASLLKRGRIEYRTSGSPSCWSNWYSVRSFEDAQRLLEVEEERRKWGYTNIEFRIS
jgi:hypothetical protein